MTALPPHFNITMLADLDTVIVGLSGGADSVALLHMLRFSVPSLHLNLFACHVNHLLRDEESMRDQQFSEKLCMTWDIPFFCKTTDVRALAAQQNLGLEECGRNVRYAFFEEIAKLQSESAWIATAHTASDNAETLLFNLARGTGLKGLCGIPPMRGRIIRPLLSMTRTDIEAYCTEYALSFVTDSSNLSDDYARNRIRHQIIPLLQSLNSRAEQHMSFTAELLRQDEDFLEQTAQSVFLSAMRESGLVLSSLQEKAASIRDRVLMLFLKEYHFQCSRKNLAEINRLLLAGKGAYNCCGNQMIAVKDGILLCYHLPAKDTALLQNAEIPLIDGLFASKTGKSYKIKTLSIGTSQTFNKVYKNLFAICLDCGKICGSVHFRSRKAGDKIKLAGTAHTKSLKKLFQEQQIDLEMRTKLFILADEQGIVAVEGIGIAERVCCDGDTLAEVSLTELPTNECR